jgi:hypothetical protein
VEFEYWQAFSSPSPQHGHIDLDTLNSKAPVDWDRDFDEAPSSKEPLRVAIRRAEALNFLYQTDKATPGHAVWYTRTYTQTSLMIVKAVARIIGAERDLKMRKK